jgi:hypothetical protein
MVFYLIFSYFEFVRNVSLTFCSVQTYIQENNDSGQGKENEKNSLQKRHENISAQNS